MTQPNFLQNETFWKALARLTKITDAEKTQTICNELEISKKDLNRTVSFLQELNYPIEIDNECISKTAEIPSIKFEFSFLEWISFQAFFPLLEDQAEAPYYKILSHKLAEIESENKKHDLFQTTESLSLHKQEADSSVISLFNEHLPIIEQAIMKQSVLSIKMKNNKKIFLYPHRIVHLESSLKLVGEDISDQCLITFDLDLVKNIELDNIGYHANYTIIEVNEFISGFREVSGNEIRLVLKILINDEHLDLTPSYHFLGDPYITTNSLGETIWAANIEPCEDLIFWLIELGDCIEILDPTDFKAIVEGYKKPSAA